MVPAGAASHELRALACLSRISTSRGRTEDARDTARRFPPGIRAQRSAGRVGGREKGRARGHAGGSSGAPARPSFDGVGKGACGPLELRHNARSSSGGRGLLRPGVARGPETATRALQCRVPARSCSGDPASPCGCPAELSASRSPARPGASSAHAQQRAGPGARLGQAPCPLTRCGFAAEMGARGAGVSLRGCRKEYARRAPREFQEKAIAGSWGGVWGAENKKGWRGEAGCWSPGRPAERPALRQSLLRSESPSKGYKVWLARLEGFLKVESSGNRERPRGGVGMGRAVRNRARFNGPGLFRFEDGIDSWVSRRPTELRCEDLPPWRVGRGIKRGDPAAASYSGNLGEGNLPGRAGLRNCSPREPHPRVNNSPWERSLIFNYLCAGHSCGKVKGQWGLQTLTMSTVEENLDIIHQPLY